MPPHIAVLPGDGIGPEVMTVAIQVLEAVKTKFDLKITHSSHLVGGAAIDATGSPLPPETMSACEQADAILFGSVGGPKWENLPPDQQPERGALLPLRKQFNLYANLRPGICHPALTHSSPIKNELIPNGFDILCVRELTGGIYFGQPKSITNLPNGDVQAIDTMVYCKSEIERIAHIAFQAAQKRNNELLSVDKANVLQNSLLWRETVNEVSLNYPDVKLSHMYVDNASMQLIKHPTSFDTILTSNLFGDILSDELAILSGSLGMLPSASLGNQNSTGLTFGLYEPSGGSAPDIAGKNTANPVAQVLSLALLFQYSLGLPEVSTSIHEAVKKTISDGFRTSDIATGASDETLSTTSSMGNEIILRL